MRRRPSATRRRQYRHRGELPDPCVTTIPAAIAAATSRSRTTIALLAVGEMSPSNDPLDDPAGLIACRGGGENAYLAASTPLLAVGPPPLTSGPTNATTAVAISSIWPHVDERAAFCSSPSACRSTRAKRAASRCKRAAAARALSACDEPTPVRSISARR